MQQYYEVGKIVSTFGIKGEIIFQHHLKKNTSLKGLIYIFIEERKESFLPYFIEFSNKKTEQEILLKLEGINSKEEAAILIQKNIWLTEKDFKKYTAEKSLLSLLNFTIISKKEHLGKIIEVIDAPLQKLGKIIINKKEVLIPLNEQTIIKINTKQKEIYVALPEGLLEIYLD